MSEKYMLLFVVLATTSRFLPSTTIRQSSYTPTTEYQSSACSTRIGALTGVLAVATLIIISSNTIVSILNAFFEAMK